MLTIDQLRAAESTALEAWQTAARDWHAMNQTPYVTSNVRDGTSVLVAQGIMRVKARAWAEADAALRAALEQGAADYEDPNDFAYGAAQP
jgi:hypothetical protein